MRTTVTLDDDIYETVLHLSQVSGERLGKVLSDLARQALRPSKPDTRRAARRFPVFEVPPNTPLISMSRIQEMIDEEG